MAWIHNGKRYWYHNGRRYSRNLKRKKYYKKRKRYFWVDRIGGHHETDYGGYMDAKYSNNPVFTLDDDNISFDNSDLKADYTDPDIWSF